MIGCRANSPPHIFDNAGRNTSIQMPDGRTVGLTYDSVGNLSSITPPGRPAYSFISNLVNLFTNFQEPTVGATPTQTIYAYNPGRQLTSITRPNGQVINLHYSNTNGRLLSIVTPAGTFAKTYDFAGNLASESSPDGILSNYIHVQGRLVSTINSGAIGGSVTYRNRRLDGGEIAAGIDFVKTYDRDDLLISNGPMSLTRHPQSGLVTATTIGAFQDSFGYNAFGELTNYQMPGYYVSNIVRDNLGRVTFNTETILGVTTTYGYLYDLSGRLTTVTRNGLSYGSYSHDSNSNRIAATVNGQSITATYDNQDRIVSYGTNIFTFDNAGQLISKTGAAGTTTYTYSPTGKLKSVTVPAGTTESFLYDGKDRITARINNGVLNRQFIYDTENRIVAVLNAAGAVRERLARFPLGPPFPATRGRKVAVFSWRGWPFLIGG